MSQFSILELFSSIIAFSPMIAWFLAGLLGVFFVVVSFVLSYHWKRFGIETAIMARASLLYFSVSVGLLATMAISLAVYLNSI